MTKSYVGKIYAVFWIIVGMTICSIFTATITSEFIDARRPANTDMVGRPVGVLKGRTHDIAVVGEHGGILKIGIYFLYLNCQGFVSHFSGNQKTLPFPISCNISKYSSRNVLGSCPFLSGLKMKQSSPVQ